MIERTNLAQTPSERLLSALAPQVEAMGYELVHLEVLVGRQKLLRLFIDHLDSASGGIKVEDCVIVSRTLDEPLETLPEVIKVFGENAYELEVSSPGIDRPLRKETDYQRFTGREARIHVFRPLTAEELENSEYQQKNPKQKNFVGVLKGIREQKVLLSLESTQSLKKKKDKKVKETMATQVLIPLPLISKANLEPCFEFLDEKEKE